MGKTLQVTPMEKEDIDIVYRMGGDEKEFRVEEDGECFWPRETLERWVDSKDDASYVIKVNGNVAGFLLATYNGVCRKATVENVYISEEFRNDGLAGMLYQRAEDFLIGRGARNICSFVDIHNDSSLEFLKRQFFSKGKAYFWMNQSVGG